MAGRLPPGPPRILGRFSTPFASITGSCWFLPGPTGDQELGPQSLRAPAFSTATLGFLHDRGHSKPARSTPRRSTPTAPPGPLLLNRKVLVLPADLASGSSRCAATERNHRCTGSAAPPRHRGRRWPPDPAPIYPL